MKRWLIMIGAVVGIALIVAGIHFYKLYTMYQAYKAGGVPKQTVSTTVAGYQQWQPSLKAIGSVRAKQGADLSAEVAGVVDEINFNSGDEVAAGTLLLQLRDADDRARLDSLKASAALADLNYQRDRAQFEAKAISQATLDSDAATLKSAQAQVAEQEALVEKKKVRAPFAGQLGIRAVDRGQYLAPGTAIVNLQQLDPIYVDFNLPQQVLGQLKIGQLVNVTTDAYPGLSFKGRISTIAPKVDTDTRNLAVRASLDNPKHQLLPGMYANIAIDTGAMQRYLTLPQNAITFNPYGETVFVVMSEDKFKALQPKAEGATNSAAAPATSTAGNAAAAPALVVKQVLITVGPSRGDQIAIVGGVTEGDQVVTSGQTKLKNGTLVDINNSVQPTNDPDPKPAEH